MVGGAERSKWVKAQNGPQAKLKASARAKETTRRERTACMAPNGEGYDWCNSELIIGEVTCSGST